MRRLATRDRKSEVRASEYKKVRRAEDSRIEGLRNLGIEEFRD